MRFRPMSAFNAAAKAQKAAPNDGFLEKLVVQPRNAGTGLDARSFPRRGAEDTYRTLSFSTP